MLRSKIIDDYIEAKLTDFRPGVPVPVDVHLYFSRNRHLLVWRSRGESVSQEIIDKYNQRGLIRVWIHRDDSAAWQSYLDSQKLLLATNITPTPSPTPQTVIRPVAPAAVKMRTVEGQAIHEVLRHPELNEKERAALVAVTARSVIVEVAQSPTPEIEAKNLAHAREAARDVMDIVLESVSAESKQLANEIWELAAAGEELKHSVDVAIYAVLFAMSFGRIDESLLADIAIAGLVHDIGLCLVPADVVATPQVRHLYAHRQSYSSHIDGGIALLNAYAPGVSPRAKAIITQHHEKFNGTGFPRGLQGFQLDDIAQLLILADMLESISSGNWDGTARSFPEALKLLESVERARTFPEFFNPDIFAAVIRWLRDKHAGTAARNAAEMVRAKAREILEREERRNKKAVA